MFTCRLVNKSKQSNRGDGVSLSGLLSLIVSWWQLFSLCTSVFTSLQTSSNDFASVVLLWVTSESLLVAIPVHKTNHGTLQQWPILGTRSCACLPITTWTRTSKPQARFKCSMLCRDSTNIMCINFTSLSEPCLGVGWNQEWTRRRGKHVQLWLLMTAFWTEMMLFQRWPRGIKWHDDEGLGWHGAFSLRSKFQRSTPLLSCLHYIALRRQEMVVTNSLPCTIEIQIEAFCPALSPWETQSSSLEPTRKLVSMNNLIFRESTYEPTNRRRRTSAGTV